MDKAVSLKLSLRKWDSKLLLWRIKNSFLQINGVNEITPVFHRLANKCVKKDNLDKLMHLIKGQGASSLL